MKWTVGLLVTAVMLASGGSADAQTTPPSRDELTAKGLQPLDGPALTQLLAGNTLYHVVPANGFKVPIHYRADGSRVVRLRGQETASKWRVEGNTVCEDSVFLNREVCREIFSIDGTKGAVCEKGQPACSNLTDWAAGNPEGLGR